MLFELLNNVLILKTHIPIVSPKSSAIQPRGSKYTGKLKKHLYKTPLNFLTRKIIGFLPANEMDQVASSITGDIEKDMEKILLTRFVPPSVVLNQDLNIVQFFGITEPYLGSIGGKESFNILKMIREDLLTDLKTLLQLVQKTEKVGIKEGIKISGKKNTSKSRSKLYQKKRVVNCSF